MLNEIKEYEQYTISTEEFKNNTIQPRLKFNTLLPNSKKDHGRSGMTRAMTIIARGYIFGKDGKKDYKSLFNNKGIFDDEDVIEVLKSWCGLEITKENDLFENKWLKHYIRYALFEMELNKNKEVRRMYFDLFDELNKSFIDIDIAVERYVKLKNYFKLQRSLQELKSKKRKNKESIEQNNKLEETKKSIDFLTSVNTEKFEEEALIEFERLRRIVSLNLERHNSSDKEVENQLKRISKINDFLLDYEETFKPDKSLMDYGDKNSKGITSFNKTSQNIKNKEWKRKYLNDLKAIKFESIIANALNEGPLHRYYLACNKDPIERIRKDSDTPIGKHAKNPDLQNNCRDKILKTTACYLLQRLYPFKKYDFDRKCFLDYEEYNQKFVYFNRQDLINWLKVINLRSSDLPRYTFTTENGKEPIFEFDTIAGNTSKLKVNPLWIKTFDFKLIEEHDIDKPENKDLIFYSDWGSGEYLVEGKRYED